jgi:hypothetical protein
LLCTDIQTIFRNTIKEIKTMAEYALVKSFQIDDGELKDLSQQQCFVLGYELAQIDEMLKGEKPFTKLVRGDNSSRIQKSCLDAGRKFELSWMPEDSSEEWMWLSVY